MNQQDISDENQPNAPKPALYARELNLGELFHFSWKIYNRHFPAIMLLSLLAYLPASIIIHLVPFGFVETLFPGEMSQNFVNVAKSLVEAFFQLLLTLSLVNYMNNDISGHKTAVLDSAGFALSFWPKAILTGLLLMIFLMGLTLLLILPAIIFGVFWIFAIAVIARYGVWGVKSLEYSRRIVKGRWLKVFGYSLLIVILQTFLFMIAATLLAPLPDMPALGIITDTALRMLFSYFLVFTSLIFLNFDENLVS